MHEWYTKDKTAVVFLAYLTEYRGNDSHIRMPVVQLRLS